MIAVPPHIIVLRAMASTIAAVDFPTELGPDIMAAIGDVQFTVRHRRNRPPPDEARPSITIVWNGNSDPDNSYLSLDERAKQMECELVIDMELPPEDSNQDDTGWSILSSVSAIAFGALRGLYDNETGVSLLMDWPVDGDLSPDDEASGPDNGRLVQTVTVLYRVSTNDPNMLLAEGA